MLYSLVNSKELLTHTPHADEFSAWKRRLADAELKEIAREIADEIERASDVRTTPTFEARPDWAKASYQPILRTACLGDKNAARRCFAIFVWEALKQREEEWTFHRQNGTKTAVEELRYYVMA